MAEKVVFRGGELDGSQIENAASEATLQLILESLSKIPGGSKKQQRIQDLYNRSVGQSTGALDDHTEEVKRNKSAVSSLGESFGSVAGATGKVVGVAVELTNRMMVLKDSLFDYLAKYRQVSSAGVDLGENFLSTAQVAADARINLETFATLVHDNAVSLAALGGNAAMGAQIFAKITKDMNRSGIQQKFLQLGYSVAEIGEATAGYLELQSKLGRGQRMTDTQLRQGTEAYIIQLDKLARVTGLNRKEAEKAMRAQLDDERVQALMANLPEEARAALAGVTTAIQSQSPKLAEVMTELVATGGIPMSDLGKSVAMQVPILQEYARRLREGSITQEEVIDGIRREAQARGKLTKEEEKLHAILVADRKESPYAARVLLQGLSKFGEASGAAYEQQQKAMEDNKKFAAGIDQLFQNIRSTFVSAFIETGLLDKLAHGFSLVIKAAGDLLNTIDLEGIANKFKNFSEENIYPAVESFLKKLTGPLASELKTTLSEVLKEINPFTEELKDKLFDALKIGLGVAVAGLFVSAAAHAAISKGIERLFSGGGGPSLPGSGSGGSRGGAGRGLPNMGSATGGTLTGIANGIGAFANPKVALGAAAMAAAIALIGAGIAGAAWITGKALPTLSEGVKSFEVIDGEKLTLAGDGMVTLAKGLAAMAGGSLVQGLTAPLTAITEAIGDFFGADSPIEKLQKFAQSDFDYEKVNRNAVALGAFGDAVNSIGDFDFKSASSLEIIEDLSPRKIEMLARSFQKLADSAGKVSNLQFDNFTNLLGNVTLPTISQEVKQTVVENSTPLVLKNPESVSAVAPSTPLINPNTAVAINQTKTLEVLGGIKEAITGLSEDLNVLKPADNSQLVNNTRDQNHNLVELQELIKMLNANVSELLIVQRKAHNINRRTLDAVKQDSNYF